MLSAETFGAEVHAFVGDSIEVEALVEELEGQGLGPVEAKEITPSLEDSFIALVRRQVRLGAVS